jgi:hypothetical protein
MSRRIAPAALLLAAGLCVTALAASSAVKQRPDCPGKIVCPLSGDLVCADRCPLGTGTPANTADDTSPLPACCRARN